MLYSKRLLAYAKLGYCPCRDADAPLRIQGYPNVRDCYQFKDAGLCSGHLAKPTCAVTCGKCNSIWPVDCP